MKYSIIHLYIYGRIKKEAKNSDIITISRINPIIKWVVRIPHKYQKYIVNELIREGFLERINLEEYKIKDINKAPLYDSLGEPLW